MRVSEIRVKQIRVNQGLGVIQKCEQDQENCIEYKLHTRCFILSGLLDCFDKSGNFFITICTYKCLYILSEID